jgi:hypothetical protein
LAAGAAVSLKAYREQEKAEQKVRQVIAATGQAAGVTAKEVFAMASSLQSVTTFGDEAILEAQSIILTFREIGGDVLPQVTEAVLNMSAVMGTDARSSAIQLGKALNDPKTQLSALARVGIKFTEDQTKFIKHLVDTNELAKAQAVILEELEKEFGGVARALANGTGAFEQASNAAGDLTEEIGRNLAPEAILIAQKFKEITESLTANSGKMLEFKAKTIGAIAAVNEAFGALIDGIGFGAKAIIAANLAVLNIFSSEKRTKFLAEARVFGELSIEAFSNIGERTGEAYTKALVDTFSRAEQFSKDEERAALLRESNEGIAQEQQEFSDRLLNQKKENAFREQSELSELFLEFNELNLEELQLAQEGREIVEIEHLNRLQEIRNEAHRTQLAQEAGFQKRFGQLTQQEQDRLKALHGSFGQTLVNIDETVGRARVDVVNEVGNTLQNAFSLFGQENTALAKGFQIAQITINALAEGAKVFGSEIANASMSGTTGFPGLITGGILATAITANAAIAIAQILSQKNTKKGGLRLGMTGMDFGGGERFMSSFSPREIVIPESFSEGIRRGQLTLAGPESEEEAPPEEFTLEINLSEDAARLIQISDNENDALGVRVNTF